MTVEFFFGSAVKTLLQYNLYFNLDYLHNFQMRKCLGWNSSQVIAMIFGIRFSKTAGKNKMEHLFRLFFSSQHSFCSWDE